jgi:UDP-N-acetylmuramoyl-L-alanyl-D-glutamate--2,6-diaminopimelate ligase
MASQPSFLLADLLNTSSMRLLYGSSSCPIQQVVADSRHVVPGALFVAVRGHRVDGHDFLGDVLDRGATALVVEALPQALQARVEREGQTVVEVPNSRQALATIATAYYRHPSRQLTLIGVTGTNGKTTTTYMVEAILQAAGRSVGVIGTVENRFAGSRVEATQTTPGALEVQAMLRQMRDRGVDTAVMEVTSHALDQDRVTGCEFAICVFTNLSRDHYDYHGSEEAYYAAKARLFTELPGCWHVLNLDDPYGRKLLEASQSRVFTYGIDHEATLTPRDVVHGLDGIRFTLPTTKGTLEVQSSLVGRHNVYNLLASVAVGLALDVNAEAILRGTRQLTEVPGRLERVDAGQDFYVFVDYAHTPDALEQVLRTVRTETPGRLITVFGCGGDRDPGKRPLMGRIATAISDYTVMTSDNPRTESPEAIVADIVAGVEPSSFYTTMVDREQAIAHAIAKARPKDTVVIAGKGHETYQIVGQTRRHFDDREVVREALHHRS